MRKFCAKAVGSAAAFMIALSAFQLPAYAVPDSGFTSLQTTYNPYCYANITIEGNHFTVDGRVENDPAIRVKFSTDEVTMSDYTFTEEEDHTFHAEFNAEFSGDWCNFWIVKESLIVMAYRLQHGENGWYFPDNGLAEKNAEKLENINIAPVEAAAYYISMTADPAEIEETLAELERIVQEVCGDEQDDYRKAYLIYRWISENFYYDNDAAHTEVTLDTIAIHNVLERQRTTCAGFSNTYSALLEIAGIRSVNLKGAAVASGVTYEELLTTGENHEFVAFWYEAENRWVFADPTWGRTGMYENGEYTREYPANYRYFDESPESFALLHRIDKVEERSYLAVLNDPEESSDTTSDAEESPITEESETTTGTTERTLTTTRNDEAPQNGSFVIYIVIGAVGVVIVITGIILATKNRKDK